MLLLPLFIIIQLLYINLATISAAATVTPNYSNFSFPQPHTINNFSTNLSDSTTTTTVFSTTFSTPKLQTRTTRNERSSTTNRATEIITTAASTPQLSSDFDNDCSDHRFAEIRCRVHYVSCTRVNANESTAEAANAAASGINRAKQSQAPHDLRFDPIAKALAQRGENSRRQQLTVDLSWQTPPNNFTRHSDGYTVEIVETRNSDKAQSPLSPSPRCFFFNISGSNWTQEAISASPRLHFLSWGVFQFARVYDVTVRGSLLAATVHRRFAAPIDPEHENRGRDGSSALHLNQADDSKSALPPAPNCSKFSHEFASQWTAGFRRIVIHALARMIQVEFVGAPPQYCFEQYEVRLLDETATEMLHSGIVNARQMNTEIIDNATVYFGEYNFTNLELDRSYIPSLIPVERALDGRCLCPVNSVDPYDNKVICSCVAADWKPIHLKYIDITQGDTANLNTTALPPNAGRSQEPSATYWHYILMLNVAFLLLLSCAALLILLTCQKRGKIGRVRFIKSDAMANGAPQNSSNLYFEPSDAAVSQTPLILPVSAAVVGGGKKDDAFTLSVLLVYAHDCAEHEASVLALAHFLRDTFGISVALDKWDECSIENNTADYLSASVVGADAVIIINSLGAIQRFHAKIAPGEKYAVERNTTERFDHLFLPQLEMALQHPCVVSVRFAGTPHAHVLPILHGRLQYVVPDNLAQFVGALLGRNVKQDPRFNHPLAAQLAKRVREFNVKNIDDPDWFKNTHHRRALQSAVAPRSSLLESDDVSTESTRSRQQELLPIINPRAELANAVATTKISPRRESTTRVQPAIKLSEWDLPEAKETKIEVETKRVNLAEGQLVHVQPNVNKQITTSISFDSTLIAGSVASVTGGVVENSVVQLSLPSRTAHSTMSVPLVTVVPASPMLASPLLEIDESPLDQTNTVNVVNKAYDNDGKQFVNGNGSQAAGDDDSPTISSLSEEEAEENVEEDAEDEDLHYGQVDSGIFTETFEHPTQFEVYAPRLKPFTEDNNNYRLQQNKQQLPPKTTAKTTTSVMITERDDLRETARQIEKKLKRKMPNGQCAENHNADAERRRAAKRNAAAT